MYDLCSCTKFLADTTKSVLQSNKNQDWGGTANSNVDWKDSKAEQKRYRTNVQCNIGQDKNQTKILLAYNGCPFDPGDTILFYVDNLFQAF